MINMSNVPPHLNLYPVKAVWILSNTKTFMQRLLDRVIGMCVVKKKYGEGVCVYVIWGLREVYVQCVRWALSETRKVENISDSSFGVGFRKTQGLSDITNNFICVFLHGHCALTMHCIIYPSYQTPLIHQFITNLLSAWEFTWVHFAAQLQPDASLKIKTNFLSLPHHQFCFFWDCNKIRIFAIINIAQWYRSITCNLSYKEQRYTKGDCEK